MDSDPTTDWVISDYQHEYGVGEWIKIDMKTTYAISKIEIRNSEDGYYDPSFNFKGIEISFSDGSTETAELSERNPEWNSITIDPPVNTDFVRILSTSLWRMVHKEGKAAISEIRLYGMGNVKR